MVESANLEKQIQQLAKFILNEFLLNDDNEYFKLYKGEILVLKFKLPKNLNQKIFLYAKGYYEPISIQL